MTIEFEALRKYLCAWMTGAERPRLRTFDLERIPLTSTHSRRDGRSLCILSW
jgi:hypothetical protein